MKESRIFMKDSPVLNKNERELLNKVLSLSQINKIAEITLEQEEVISLTKVKEENLHTFLINLSSKLLTFNIQTQNDTFTLYTTPFSFLSTKNLYLFVVSSIIFNSINGDDFFSKFKLQYFLRLKLKKSYKLYTDLINTEDTFIAYSLDTIKEILVGKATDYDRFFDFEKYILAPTINDINQNTDILVDYKKIREGKFIKNITLHIHRSKDKQQIVKYFFEIFQFNFMDVETIINRIHFLSDYFTYDELAKFFKHLKLSLSHSKKLEIDIINMLTTTNVKNTLTPTLIIREKFDTSLQLFHRLNEEISKLELPFEINQNFYPTDFLTIIYTNTLKNYSFSNEHLKVDIQYRFHNESTIIIDTIK